MSALDVVFVQQTKRGKMIANSKKTINLIATPEQFDQLKKKGFIAGEDLNVNSDTETVRVVVLDRSTGFIGSVTVTIASTPVSNPAPEYP